MKPKNVFSGCFLILLVSLASPLFPGDSGQGAGKNFVMFIEEEFGYSPNFIRTTEGSYVSITAGTFLRRISESGEMNLQREVYFPLSTNEQYGWLGAIAETNDGYILVGAIWDWDDIPYRAVIVKLGTDGSVQWSKTFESQTKVDFHSVSLAADGGFIVQGRTWPPRDTVIVKFTATGDILWSKIFDHLPLYNTFSQPVSDGIILASKKARSGLLRILKVNDSGNIVWKKSLRINRFHFHSMGPSSDSGVILAGKSSRSIMLVRVNSDGKVDWNAAYSLKDHWFAISSVARTSDDGYVISGTKLNGENYENAGGFIIKVDSKQELVFHEEFGRSDRKEYAGQIFPTADGGYAIFGRSDGESGLHTLFLNVNSEGVVPGCSFFQKLKVRKVASAPVASRKLELSIRNLSLTASSIDINLLEAENPSSSVCP
jgi:hypothetical protein